MASGTRVPEASGRTPEAGRAEPGRKCIANEPRRCRRHETVESQQGKQYVRLGQRRLPLHETTTQALVSYTHRRDQLCPHPKTDSFFVSVRGTRLDHSVVDAVFRSLIRATGIDRTAHRHLRAYDLRHSFAVETLTAWYRSGTDVGTRLPALSTYMGHVSPSSTYWYLESAPELLSLATQRLEGPR